MFMPKKSEVVVDKEIVKLLKQVAISSNRLVQAKDPYI